MLDRAWEIYEGGPTVERDAVRVTINRQGHIYLNRKAYEVFSKPNAVLLYYNRDQDAIALEAAPERSQRSFRVDKKDFGFVIHAAPFCRHYRIRITNTERFISPTFTSDGLLILNLRQTTTAGGFTIRRRSKSQSGGIEDVTTI